jgi:hypothetical protein
MRTLLAPLHAIAARRGDGLRPEPAGAPFRSIRTLQVGYESHGSP